MILGLTIITAYNKDNNSLMSFNDRSGLYNNFV